MTYMSDQTRERMLDELGYYVVELGSRVYPQRFCPYLCIYQASHWLA
jgi:hypothetical protein